MIWSSSSQSEVLPPAVAAPGSLLRCEFSGPTRDLVNEQLQGAVGHLCFTGSAGDSHAGEVWELREQRRALCLWQRLPVQQRLFPTPRPRPSERQFFKEHWRCCHAQNTCGQPSFSCPSLGHMEGSGSHSGVSVLLGRLQWDLAPTCTFTAGTRVPLSWNTLRGSSLLCCT